MTYDRWCEISGLGDRLGVLLVQLPPKLALEKRVAGNFFRALRKRIDVPVACEPRHASWFTTNANDWLAGRGIARVAADPAKVPEGGEPAAGPALPIFAGTDRRGPITPITTMRRLQS